MSFIEAADWPDKLTGHVAQAGREPRIHGYDVENDLARHYGLAELVLLILCGELPEPGTVRAFEIAVAFLAPAPVSDGPSHCAVLAQAVGSPAGALIATAAVALGEEARCRIEAQADLLRWLDQPSTPPPEAHLCSDADEASVARLRQLLVAAGCEVPALAHSLGRAAALTAVLHQCGLRRPDQIHSALVLSRLPCAVAEGFAARHGKLKDYPTSTPRFEHAFDP